PRPLRREIIVVPTGARRAKRRDLFSTTGSLPVERRSLGCARDDEAIDSPSAQPPRQLDDAGAEDRQLVVLLVGFLLDRDQVPAVLDVFARHLALDEQDVARRIVAADLARRVAQETVVAHP